MKFYKETLSLIAILITFYSFFPYIKLILKSKIRPHFFSWMIWSISTITVFIAGYFDNGGFGLIPILISGILTILVSILCMLKKTDLEFKKLDFLFLIISLISILGWILFENANLTILFLTLVDLSGFGPTLRKIKEDANSESSIFYFLFFIRNLFVILALENHSFITLCFPILVGFSSLLVSIYIFFKKKYA